MRRTLTGRALAMCAGVVMIVGIAAGCSSESDDSAPSATSSAAASSAPATADAAVTKEITDAYTVFFNGQTPPDQRAALIESGAAFTPVLQGLTQNPQSMQTTVNVKSVTLVDDTHADVSYDLLMAGNPALPDQSGQAVKVDGTWKVADDTFCALMAVQGGAEQIPVCA
ncbi:hypothetical protein [Gordonia insulae]|uniref:Low molecular weight antigen MTB12-like C-terminal domain-containing protein n=1 Tax=Gordonia insulae TaxID=2420509 RepID=A0A3G8JL34_9ACTN|nr:hypothetical protein [Gordonia insulae]AZG45791.1 hypothetical protein D7316_02391 [Gordonia insulae]